MSEAPLGDDRAVQPPEEAPSIRLGKVVAQPGLVDLPVAVLAAVEQNHREAVAELSPQSRVARRRRGIDVRRRQIEAQFSSQSSQQGVYPRAGGAPVAGQQLHLWPAWGLGHGHQCGISLWRCSG